MKKENAQQGAQSISVSGNEYNTTSPLVVFNNAQFGHLTALTDHDGRCWFIAKEVATALGYKNPRDALAKHVDTEDKGVANRDTLGGTQVVTTINESGLYALIFSSKMEQAKTFKRWVTNEVLPSIRQHGGYIHGQSELNPDELLAMAVLVANEAIAERELENKRLHEVVEDLTHQFATGVTIPVFCMQFNGVNTQQVQPSLSRMGVLVREKHGYRPAAPHRNSHFKVSTYSYAPGRDRFTPTVTRGGATFLYSLYRKGKLPMLKNWDGQYTTSQLTEEQLNAFQP